MANEDFINTYMEYTSLLESPDVYHKWTALSIISACIGRKVWVDLGYFKVFPNMFIVLVGPPGKCRKGAALNAGINLLTNIPNVNLSADSTTRESLIQVLDEINIDLEINGEIQKHSSLTIVSKELSVFLGTGNHDLLSFLTDLYDNPNIWTYKTKNKGTNAIKGVWLGMLAASTSTWLVGSIPLTAIGGGFTSRVLFIVADDVRHKEPYPILTQKELELRELLKTRLHEISMFKGRYILNDKALNAFTTWYNHNNIKIDDSRFAGYSERKHIHLLKVATLLAVSQGNIGFIDETNIKTALEYLNEIEPKMIEAFGSAGRSMLATDIEELLKAIKAAGKIERKQLLTITFREVHPNDFNLAIQSLIDMGLIKYHLTGGKVFYEFIG